MGNLRNRYTSEEWDELDSKIKADKKQGKPSERVLYLSIVGKDVNELIHLRNTLYNFYSHDELSTLNEWINWKAFKQQEQ
jgi:hypothetical protein